MYDRCLKPHFDSMHEECGIFGVYSPETRNVAHTVYYGLYALQHRGQESGGIAVAYANKIEHYKNMGLIPEIFADKNIDRLPEGDIAIGHVRYSTTGASLVENSQPIVFTGKCGRISIAHNGNLINTKELRDGLLKENAVFQTTIDTEVIGSLINKYSDGDIVKGVLEACKYFKGSFSLLVMTTDKLIAVRDPYAIRPLVLGKYLDEYFISSETCGLDAVGANYVRDIEPGEVLVIDSSGERSYKIQSDNNGRRASCIFEYVYFARPDSVIDGCSVYESRKLSGKLLAKHFPVDADMVSGVPDSAVVAARGYSEVAGIPYIEALAKNRYVGRTFIQPEQVMRESSVKVKLNALRANVSGKRVVLIDDSIVRGTTSKKIVQMLKDAGAKEVHMRISSPIVKHPCYFGIDMQTRSQLIGAFRTEQEICDYIGADSLKFLTLDQLCETVCGKGGDFCVGCFSGEYPWNIDSKEEKKVKLD